MADHDILDQQIVYQRGSFQRIKRWWRGIRPGRGTITWGWTGWETVEETDRVIPTRVTRAGI